MSNICVPGGRSTGWNAEGVARHMQTQGSVSQQLWHMYNPFLCLWERSLPSFSHLFFFFFLRRVVYCLYCFPSATKRAAAAVAYKKRFLILMRLIPMSKRWNWKNKSRTLKGGHLSPFETRALTVMCGRVNHYPNYVLLHNRCLLSWWSRFVSPPIQRAMRADMQMRGGGGDAVVLNVHRCCKYFCLSSNDWKHTAEWIQSASE